MQPPSGMLLEGGGTRKGVKGVVAAVWAEAYLTDCGSEGDELELVEPHSYSCDDGKWRGKDQNRNNTDHLYNLLCKRSYRCGRTRTEKGLQWYHSPRPFG